MEDHEDMLQKVLKLKRCLSQTQDHQKIMKAFKGLQDLEISKDILEETEVGRTVNGFRNHAALGNLAKSLINRWKKLLPQTNPSEPLKRKHHAKSASETSNKKIRTLSSKENKCSDAHWSSESNCKQKKVQKQRKDNPGSFIRCKKGSKKGDLCQDAASGQERSNFKDNDPGTSEPQISAEKSGSSKTAVKFVTVASKKSSTSEREKSRTDQATKLVAIEPAVTGESNLKPKDFTTGGDFELSSMSFESCLNYDQVSSCRRKRKACQADGHMANSSITLTTKGKEEKILKPDEHLETSRKKAKTSLQDLLNIPLPKVLPEISLCSPPYVTEFKAQPVLEIPQEETETPHFTGRRLNSKMQVYSGHKVVCLPKMLSLYEQCIRVLQNNINSLHEVGGVPFKILEPVLTCCTPEQLLRIEDCNQAFIEESDHLWKKHCQKDFRNEQLLECESWRGMYLRLFSEREEKLKSITKSILSAQSEKPKGRQIKMAFVHGVVKPCRTICHLKSTCGTSEPVIQLQSKPKNPENQRRNRTSSTLVGAKARYAASGSASIYTDGIAQDSKKTTKKMAPMMRKSLRAFKNRVGP